VHDWRRTPCHLVTQDPVTVLGAWQNATGQQELDELFAHLAATLSDCTSYELEA
jgi:hypothetical protein